MTSQPPIRTLIDLVAKANCRPLLEAWSHTELVPVEWSEDGKPHEVDVYRNPDRKELAALLRGGQSLRAALTPDELWCWDSSYLHAWMEVQGMNIMLKKDGAHVRGQYLHDELDKPEFEKARKWLDRAYGGKANIIEDESY